MFDKPAGLTRRFFAKLTDYFIIGIIFLLPSLSLLPFLKVGNTTEANYPLVNMFFYLIIAGLLYNTVVGLYQIYFTSRYAGTLGKYLWGLKVVDADTKKNIDIKTAFYRVFVGHTVSIVFFGLGFWSIVKDPEKRGFHDKLFSTRVLTHSGILWGVLSLIAAVVALAAITIALISKILLILG